MTGQTAPIPSLVRLPLRRPATVCGVTLDQAPAGIPVHVTAADLEPALARRLAELGVRSGQTVTPLHRTSGGGRVVSVDDTRVALARSVLRCIEVVAA